MGSNALFELLIDNMIENIPGQWTIARLNVQFLTEGQEIEFDGTYLDAAGEIHPLTTDFPEEVTAAMTTLYRKREAEGLPRANYLQLDVTTAGKYTTDFSWDQELEDEVAHFAKGGTAREWQAIRDAKYGPPTA